MSGWEPDVVSRVAELARARASSALVIVQGGDTILEEYWLPSEPILGLEVLPDGRTREDVASAQKSVTSLLVGAAVERELLDIDAAVSGYLGPGWTRGGPSSESAITVRHLLSMTSGLDDHLDVVAEPGRVSFYNLGAAYHCIKRVLCAVADKGLNELSSEWLFDPLGMGETSWVDRPVPEGTPAQQLAYHCFPDGRPFEALVTSARDLALLGTGMLRGLPGVSADYLAQALRPSTALNPAYGLLWWVNGQPWHLQPRALDRTEGWLIPGAPADLVGMLGAHGRSVHVVPSRQLVVVRLGANPGGTALAASSFGHELWALLGG